MILDIFSSENISLGSPALETLLSTISKNDISSVILFWFSHIWYKWKSFNALLFLSTLLFFVK